MGLEIGIRQFHGLRSQGGKGKQFEFSGCWSIAYRTLLGKLNNKKKTMLPTLKKKIVSI